MQQEHEPQISPQASSSLHTAHAAAIAASTIEPQEQHTATTTQHNSATSVHLCLHILSLSFLSLSLSLSFFLSPSTYTQVTTSKMN